MWVLSHLLDILQVDIPCGFLSLEDLFNGGLQFPAFSLARIRLLRFGIVPKLPCYLLDGDLEVYIIERLESIESEKSVLDTSCD